MNPKKKYLHAVYVLNRINTYCVENPESQDIVTIKCADGHVPCNSLFLAGTSQMLRDYLNEIEQTYKEPIIMAPDLCVQDVLIFFRYIG